MRRIAVGPGVASVRRMGYCGSTGEPRATSSRRCAPGSAPTTPSRWSSRRPARPGAPKRVVLSRRAVLASARPRSAGSAEPGRWLLALPASYVAGLQVVVRSLVAGHDAGAARGARLGRRRPRDAATSSRWCRPSCTGCSTTHADVAALAAFHTVLLGGGPIDPALRQRAEAAGVRVVATYGSAETAGGCVYDGYALDGVALALDRDGRIRIARADALRRLRRRPGADRRGAGRRLVPDLRRRPARRGRPAAGARPARRRGGQRRRQRARAGGRRPAARAPGVATRPRCSAYPTRSGATGWSRSWSARSTARRGPRLGRARRTRGPGRRASWSCSTRSRCCPTASPTGCAAGCGRLSAMKVFVDPDAHPVPRHHRPRGRAAPRAPAGWGEWSPFLEYDAAVAEPWLRCAEEAAAGDWPAPVRDRGPGQRHRARRRPRAGPRDRRSRGGCRTAKVKVAEPGQTLADDQARLEAVRDALGPDGRIRIDANGGWDVDDGGRRDRARSTGPPAAWSTSSSRARRVEDLAAVRRRGRRADRGRRVDPPGRRPLPGPRPRGRRHRGAQGAAARRGPRLPADRRGHRAAGRRVVGAGDLASASRPGSPWPPRCPSCPTPAAWPPCSCSTDDVVAEPLLPVDGVLPVRLPVGRRGCARPARRRARPGRALGGPAGRGAGACGRIDDRDHHRPLARAVVDRAASRRGVTEVVLAPGLAQRAAVLRGVRRRRGRAAPAAHPDRRAHRRLPRARADQGPARRPR